jgi:hypothetical protein
MRYGGAGDWSQVRTEVLYNARAIGQRLRFARAMVGRIGCSWNETPEPAALAQTK